jgi:cysteine synthase
MRLWASADKSASVNALRINEAEGTRGADLGAKGRRESATDSSRATVDAPASFDACADLKAKRRGFSKEASEQATRPVQPAVAAVGARQHLAGRKEYLGNKRGHGQVAEKTTSREVAPQ